MRAAVVIFPGINRERDMARALKLVSGREPAMVWHAEPVLPAGTDLVVIPGGFSYGDYLRCGGIAAGAAGWCSGFATVFRFSASRDYCPACSCATSSFVSFAATCICGSSAPTYP